MSLLAEANNTVPGRWVLMPRKGARLIGSRDRERIRARRRRRQIFMVLLEMTILTLLMGVFPPFRVMLYGTGVLAFVLLAYSALLVKIREEELAKSRLRLAMERRRAAEAMAAPQRARAMAASARYAPLVAKANGNGYAYSNGNGHSNGKGHANGNGHANGKGHANGNGHANGRVQANGNGHANANGHANGNGHTNGNGRAALSDILREGGVEIIEDDVHVIVRRASDLDREAARSSAR